MANQNLFSAVYKKAQKGFEQMSEPLTGDKYEGYFRMGQAKELFLEIMTLCEELEEGKENV